jgi:threonine aldolase
LNNLIDLRSDTVTKPTPEMWAAMAKAEVGDDVYGEDPNINRLEAKAADLLGKEAALFVPSGTMGNLVSILAHSQRGEEVILGDQAHTFLLEAAGISVVGSLQPRPLPNQPDGSIRLEDIAAAVRPDDPHHPVTSMIILENTHNRCGGAVLPQAYLAAVGTFARSHGLKLHLDGARLFNASAASGIAPAEIAAPFDSVTFCLSKALCAPVGSVVVGSGDFIYRAHRARKMLGGGMRQAGIVAAAGIVALDSNISRLTEDHARATRLAQMLAQIPGLQIDSLTPPTNMVYLNLAEEVPASAREVAQMLLPFHVKVHVVSERRIRLVTHYWITDSGVDRAVEGFRQVLAEI